MHRKEDKNVKYKIQNRMKRQMKYIQSSMFWLIAPKWWIYRCCQYVKVDYFILFQCTKFAARTSVSFNVTPYNCWKKNIQLIIRFCISSNLGDNSRFSNYKCIAHVRLGRTLIVAHILKCIYKVTSSFPLMNCLSWWLIW